MSRPVRLGRPYPLGATFDGEGANFALFSEHANAVELCLFDDNQRETRIRMPQRSLFVWHVYVTGVRPGQRYGYRVQGPYNPAQGLRFNPNKLLIDPYARQLDGKVDYAAPVFGYKRLAELEDLVMDDQDSACGVPKSVVVDNLFDWDNDRAPDVPWEDTVLYELHVKGFTKRHPGVPERLRGTFLGLASEAAIAHIRALGVTTVELMPIQEAVDEYALVERGTTNYWGYNTIGFFAPDQRFATRSGSQIVEFKHMVRVLHRAGIEVVLDVVYNHTGESDHLGPTLSLRGIDNPTYYRLLPSHPRLYQDYTGCGNSLNMLHPQSLKLVMDSLRYWVTEMHVDGFRFDLASTLARELHDVDRLGGFFDIIHQDPILSRVKLIAEPWDLGEGGYQVGNFPLLWTEWNGRYRDTVRRFWKGDEISLAELGYRLTGSSDLYADDGRHPHASINFVTVHDGFTLRDMVSYNCKHNLANGEDNRDGWDENGSWNCGVEGETSDPAVLALRARQQRNLLATLLLSQGVPMLASGDEFGKTQNGNNNAYCQDTELSWLDWDLDDERRALLDFTRRLIALRQSHMVFRRRDFFVGQRVGSALKDIAWFRPDGAEMVMCDWICPERPAIALLVAGDALNVVDDSGQLVIDDSFLLVMSASRDPVTFVLPGDAWGLAWELVLDTREASPPSAITFHAGDKLPLLPLSFLLLRRASPERGSWRPFKVR